MFRETLQHFLRPLYQDLDGVSRLGEVVRIADLARRFYTPASPEDERAFELLLAFHLLGHWLGKVGNASRTALAVGGIDESELRRTAASIRRLDNPVTGAEIAVAAAVILDRSGVRGLAERFASARREGRSLTDVARDALAEDDIPKWMPDAAIAELQRRHGLRHAFCRRLLEES